MKFSHLLPAFLAAASMGAPVRGRGSKQYLAPSKGPGSGRTAKCKRCGETGPVTQGPDGRRLIEGCTCSGDSP
jgi:hypothetical protein